jgi:hypothetical protein
VAILSVVCTAGIPPVLTVTAFALMVPVKLMMLSEFTDKNLKNDDTLLRTGALFTMLMMSAPPPISIAPMIFEPRSRVSVSAAGLSLMAVPPAPAIVPELVIVLPTLLSPEARIPVPLEIVPALVRLTVVASIPKNPPVTRPAFVTLAMFAATDVPPPLARMVPVLKLSTVAVVAA